jgi:preprotein translocase subunit YajC
MGAAGPLLQLAPFALILVVFYFLLVRPQQKKARETQAMLDALRVNDEIVTSGGIHGKVVKLADRIVLVEVAPKVQIRVERQSIAQVGKGGKAPEKPEEKSA